jgi:hypothetical protein
MHVGASSLPSGAASRSDEDEKYPSANSFQSFARGRTRIHHYAESAHRRERRPSPQSPPSVSVPSPTPHPSNDRALETPFQRYTRHISRIVSTFERRALDKDEEHRLRTVFRHLLTHEEMLHPSNVDYWQLFMTCMNCWERMLLPLVTERRKPALTRTMRIFWTQDCIAWSEQWIALHYMATYIRQDSNDLSLAAHLVSRRLLSIRLRWKLQHKKDTTLSDWRNHEAHYARIPTQSSAMLKSHQAAMMLEKLEEETVNTLDFHTILQDALGHIQDAQGQQNLYWASELETMVQTVEIKTLYTVTPESMPDKYTCKPVEGHANVPAFCKRLLHRLDYIALQLYNHPERISFLDPQLEGTFTIFEIYTRSVHWLCQQWFHVTRPAWNVSVRAQGEDGNVHVSKHIVHRSKFRRVQFDEASYDIFRDRMNEHASTDPEPVALSEFYNFVYRMHMTNGAFLYYQQRQPPESAFFSYFDKELESIATPSENNELQVFSDVRKRFYTEFISQQFANGRILRAFYHNEAHFMHELSHYMIFHEFMRAYDVDWIGRYVLTNYDKTSARYWRMRQGFLNASDRLLQMPIIHWAMGIPMVSFFHTTKQCVQTFVCDGAMHSIMTWFWVVHQYHNGRLQDTYDLNMETILVHYFSDAMLYGEKRAESIQRWDLEQHVYNKDRFRDYGRWTKYKNFLTKHQLANHEAYRHAEENVQEAAARREQERKRKAQADNAYQQEQRRKYQRTSYNDEDMTERLKSMMSDPPASNTEDPELDTAVRAHAKRKTRSKTTSEQKESPSNTQSGLTDFSL